MPWIPGSEVKGRSNRSLFEGQDLLKLTEEEICDVRGNRIAMIFQEPMTSLNPVLTIGRQVAEPMQVHLDMKQPEALTRAIDLLQQVQIPAAKTRVKAFAHMFSGGQRQRIGVARALSVQPDLIICDEPVSALDVSIQAQIINLLEELQEKFGLTYLFIAHDQDSKIRCSRCFAPHYDSGDRRTENIPQ